MNNVKTVLTQVAEQLPGCHRAQLEALLKGEDSRSRTFGSFGQRCAGRSRQPDPVSTLHHAGDELVDLFGGETLEKLLQNNTLIPFLDRNYQGEQLHNKLGGWLAKAMPFRGKKIIAYHKNWIYFATTFGLEILGYVEPKPGIPPSARHVQEIIKLIQDQKISLMIVANHFERNSPRKIEERTGVKAIFLPFAVHAVPEVTDTFKMIDYWIDAINENITE